MSNDLGSDDEGEEDDEEDEDDELVRLHREDSGEDIDEALGGDRGSSVGLVGGYGGMRAHHERVSSGGDIKSDDSLPDSEGEDVGIVMRKSARGQASSDAASSTAATSGNQGLRLGDRQRRALFSLDRDDSFDGEDGDGDERDDDGDYRGERQGELGDDDEDIELENDLGQGEKERIVEAFERLGIDVRTPEGFDAELEDDAVGGTHVEGKVGEKGAREREVGI